MDWLIQQQFLKAMQDGHISVDSLTKSLSSSSDSLIEQYADEILTEALRDLIRESLNRLRMPSSEVPSQFLESGTMASIQVTSRPSLQASSHATSHKQSSSSQKKVSFIDSSPQQQPNSTKHILSHSFNSPVISSIAMSSDMSSLSMTDTSGEAIPIGSEGEFFELPQLSQKTETMPSSSDLPLSSSLLSVGQYIGPMEQGTSHTSEGQIKGRHDLSSFGSTSQ